MKQCLGALALAIVMMLGATAAWAAPAYLGVKGCKMCHFKQFTSWKETKMAKAFDLLKPNVRVAEKEKAGLDPAKDYTTDKECLGCHVTGYGEQGGYGSGGQDDQLTGVGCEMCHGPGSEYVGEDRMSMKNKEFKSADLVVFGFIKEPTEAQCISCHNEKSPFYHGFDFEQRKTEGTHEHFPMKFEH